VKITSKLLLTFLLNIALFALLFAISIVIRRSLDVELAGIYKFIMLIVSSVAILGNFGINEMLILKLSEKKIKLEQYLTNVLVITIPLTVIILLFFYIYFNRLGGFFQQPLIIATLLYCLIYQLNSVFQPAIYALDKLIKNHLFEVYKQASYLICSIIFAYYHKLDVQNILYMLVFSNSFAIIYIIYLNMKSRKSAPLESPQSPVINSPVKVQKFVLTKELINNSFKIWLYNLLSFTTTRANWFILELFHGFKDLGVYSLSTILSEKLWIFPDSIRSVLYLELTNKRKGDEFVAILLRTLTLLIGSIAIILGVLSFKFIPFLFSDKYVDAVVPFVILLPGTVFYSYSRIITEYFKVKDMIYINVYASVIIASISLCLNFLLIPRFFIYGAAISTSTAFITGSVYHIIKFANTSSINFKNIFLVQKQDFVILKKILLPFEKSVEKG